MHRSIRSGILAGVLLAALSPVQGVRGAEARQSRFTGLQSCASTGCHGGGTGKDQVLTWQKRDVHTRAHAILGTARSLRIGEALGVADVAADVRCTVCHAPLAALPAVRFMPNIQPDNSFSCETCHGPAESWLRFHTRTDISHVQRVAAGMRELDDLYGRANNCISCHLNIDSDVVRAGHPELLFELDGQMRNEPPHWIEQTDPWLGPRAWLAGQAAALRELSWKLVTRPDDELLVPRWKALLWLLRGTSSGAGQLPASGDYKTVQAAADGFARVASRNAWTRDSAAQLFRRYAAAAGEFREGLLPPAELRRRAEVLVIALDRLWQALKANGSASEQIDQSLAICAGEARAQEGFDAFRFAAALQQVEVALERWQ